MAAAVVALVSTARSPDPWCGEKSSAAGLVWSQLGTAAWLTICLLAVLLVFSLAAAREVAP